MSIAALAFAIASALYRRLATGKGQHLDVAMTDSVMSLISFAINRYMLNGSVPELLGNRSATMQTVIEFNGPGNGGADIRNGVAYDIKAGDVVIIPAGTGHWFQKIDDHINYLMVRFDPDKVTPLRDEERSREYLSTPPRR